MDSKDSRPIPIVPVSCKLFLTRILFHGLLLTLYPLIAIYAFSFLNVWSLIALAHFVAICLLLCSDYVAIHRTVPLALHFILDLCLVGGMLTAQLFVPFVSQKITLVSEGENEFSEWQQTVDFSNLGIVIWALPLAIYGLYTLFLLIGSIVNWLKYRRAFGPFFAVYPTQTSFLTNSDTPENAIARWVLGRRREENEMNEIRRRCTEVVFGHTVFRKHPFEPVVLAFFRGLVATYATLGILGYGALLVNNAVTTSATAITIQRSLVTLNSALATHNGVVFSPSANLWPRTFLVLADYGGEFGNLDITSSLEDPKKNFTAECQRTPTFTIYGQNCTMDTVELTLNIDTLQINVTSNVSLSLWMIETAAGSYVKDVVNLEQLASAVHFTDPFRLYPDTHLLGTLYPVQRVQGTNSWLTFAIHNIRTDSSGTFDSGTSSLTLSADLPESQRWIQSEEIISPSVVTIVLGIISNVGGVFVAVSGVFSVIFGRGIWEVVAGGRPVSPFGLFGHLPSYRQAIHRQYPRLQEETEKGGMASFIEEVAMDTGIIRRRAYVSVPDAEYFVHQDGPEQGVRHRFSNSEIELLPRLDSSHRGHEYLVDIRKSMGTD